MDFNIATAAIGFGLLILCLAPILWLHWSASKGEKKLKDTFYQAAQNQNVQLTNTQIWSTKYGIGLDENSQKLMYGRWMNGNLETVVLNLNSIKNCSVSKEMDGNSVDKVFLQILPNNGPQQKLEFYNSDFTPSLTEEYLIAQKWQQTIGSLK